MKHIGYAISVAFLFAVLLLAGCTVTMNPGDLPTKHTTAGTGIDPPAKANGANGTAATDSANLTMETVAKHNTAADCWIVIDSSVYDLSNFASHPGGSAYVPYCGTNATSAFYNIPGKGRSHSAYAQAWAADFRIGTVGGNAAPQIAAQDGGTANSGNGSASALPQVSLNPAPGANATAQQNSTILTAAEVAKHNSASDCWIVINGAVLDLSSFTNHPGGSAYIPYCGKDGTTAYNAVGHSSYANALMANYQIGILGQAANPANAAKTQQPNLASSRGGDGNENEYEGYGDD